MAIELIVHRWFVRLFFVPCKKSFIHAALRLCHVHQTVLTNLRAVLAVALDLDDGYHALRSDRYAR